jgi:hypothetical protein
MAALKKSLGQEPEEKPKAMTGLGRRLARLEAATGVDKVFPTIFVSFIRPADTERPVRSMTINDRTYHRTEGEPEDTFRAGAMAEANEVEGRPRGAHVRVVFLHC